VDYINALPHVAAPGVFGLHDNADITKDLQEAQQLLDGLLLSQSTSANASSSSSSGGGNAGGGSSHQGRASTKDDTADAAAQSTSTGDDPAGTDHAEPEQVVKSREDVIAEIAADILGQLPPNFDLEAAEAAYPQDYFNSMNTVLVQVGGSHCCTHQQACHHTSRAHSPSCQVTSDCASIPW